MQRTLIVAAASALLLAAAVTELSSRLWPGNYFALLVLSFIALLVNGLFNIRQLGAPGLFAALGPAAPATVAAAPAAAPAAQPRPEPQRRQQPRNGDDSRDRRPARDGRSDGGGDGDTRRQRNPSERSERQPRAPAASPPATADGPREEGTVKWFNRSKGFGFIVRSNDEEIFVHQRSIRNEDGRGRPALRDGETVSFVVTHRERGQQAEDVVPVDPA